MHDTKSLKVSYYPSTSQLSSKTAKIKSRKASPLYFNHHLSGFACLIDSNRLFKIQPNLISISLSHTHSKNWPPGERTHLQKIPSPQGPVKLAVSYYGGLGLGPGERERMRKESQETRITTQRPGAKLKPYEH